MSPTDAAQGEATPFPDASLILDAALENMPAGFSIWDESYRLALWNKGYVRAYRLPPERLYPGMPMAELCRITVEIGNHPGKTAEELTALYCQRLDSCTDAAASQRYEKRLADRIILTSYARSPGLGWVVIHEDVTAARERERALATQNLRLDLALNTMPYGFCLWDAALRLSLWNDRLGALYGLDPGELRRGLGMIDFFIASADRGAYEGRTAGELFALHRERLSALDPGQVFVAEAALGSGRVVKVSHVRAPDGSFAATHEDVTADRDRVQALEQRETELARQNMRFDAAINHMSQGLCMFDRERRLIVCNRPYAEIYRLPPELVTPGTRLDDILRNRIERGVVAKASADAYVESRLVMAQAGVEAQDVVELRDGRVIALRHHPMADGGWVSTHEDVTEQRRNEARIRYLARHDALTDLPNRMEFRDRMDAAAETLRRQVMAVLFVDLDHFKAVNDLCGHAAGDAVLREVATRLRRSCREGDVVARLGGDEFAVLSGPLSAGRDAASLADRIVRAMSAPILADGREVQVGASVGIAISPQDGVDAATLMKHADLALYRAKGDGRGAFHFFEAGMDAALQERLAFELELRAALARNEFALAYQPLLSLADGRISGVEALLRWNHPERGVIGPDRIIPVAEESGLIVPIGAWVIREACMTAAKWPAHVRIAVNLSPVQFRNRDLVRHVEAALAASGLPADRLELEVTESVLLAENDATLATLHRIRDLGVRISMDDFGTGYSSLSYLRSFPFDKIKIDQSFVRDIARRQDSLAIIKAVIGLGRSLGIATTAEGVETDDQLNLVRAEGCTEAQGFLFSPPLPQGAVDRLFEETAAQAPMAKKAAS